MTASCLWPIGTRAKLSRALPQKTVGPFDGSEIDNGCYERDGTDAEGRRIEVTVNPETLEMIEIEYEDSDDD